MSRLSHETRQLIIGLGFALAMIAALGLVGAMDFDTAKSAEDAARERVEDLRVSCLPSAPGETALISWKRDGELVCTVSDGLNARKTVVYARIGAGKPM